MYLCFCFAISKETKKLRKKLRNKSLTNIKDSDDHSKTLVQNSVKKL